MISHKVRDRFQIAGVAFLVVAAPLVPFQYLSLFQNGEVSSLLLRFLPAWVCFGLLITTVLPNAGSLLKCSKRTQVLAVLFVGSSCLSIFSSSYMNDSAARTVYYGITGELLFVSVVRSRLSLAQMHRLIDLHLIAASIIGVIAVVEVEAGVSLYRRFVFDDQNPFFAGLGRTEVGRAVGSIGNPIPLGTYLALSVPLFLQRSLESRNRFGALLNVVGMSLAISGVYLSYSRSAWVAVAGGSGAYLCARRKSLLPVWGALVLGVVVVSVPSHSMGNRELWKQYIDGFHTNSRVLSYAYAIETWSGSPVLGVGLGCYRHFSRVIGSDMETPDNMFLLTLAESGLLGVGLHVGIASSVLAVLFHRVRRRNLGRHCAPLGGTTRLASRAQRSSEGLVLALACGVGAFVVSSIAWDGLRFPVTRIVFWVMAGVGVRYAILSVDRQG